MSGTTIDLKVYSRNFRPVGPMNTVTLDLSTNPSKHPLRDIFAPRAFDARQFKGMEVGSAFRVRGSDGSCWATIKEISADQRLTLEPDMAVAMATPPEVKTPEDPASSPGAPGPASRSTRKAEPSKAA